MARKKQVIGGPLEIGGRVLSLSRAIRAGDFVYLTGQIPMKDGVPMTSGSIEDQTRAVLDDITSIHCKLDELAQTLSVDFIAPNFALHCLDEIFGTTVARKVSLWITSITPQEWQLQKKIMILIQITVEF